MKNLFFLLILSFLMFSASGPKMVKTKIIKGVTASLPKGFVPMSDDDIAQKYPSTSKPLAMFTSLDRSVDFGLNVSKGNWAGSNFNILQKVYKATILDLYSNVVFLEEKQEKINGKDFILFEFTSETDGARKYTYLAYTILANAKDKENKTNRIYLFNFTAPKEDMEKWRESAKLSMRSISINQKVLGESVEEYKPVHKGKRPVQVIKDQKNNTPKKK